MSGRPASGPAECRQRPVQLRGSRLARALLRGAGWTLEFDGLPAAQGVAIVYPHTSNWDFPVGLLAKWAVGIPAHFWAKDSLFRLPLLGRFLRAVGGLPVVRGARTGIVAQTAARLREARATGRFMWLALAPEGTRSAGSGWRSGFYRVAHEAQVPVGLVVLDWAHRRVGFDSFWLLSGDPARDLATFAARLEGCRGRRPQLAAPVRLTES